MKQLFFVLAFVLASVGVANAEGTKTLVCHSTSSANNPYVLISVSDNALPAQLAQGSTIAIQLPDGTYTCDVIPIPE